MQPTDVDRAFAEFVRSRDPKALGRLFDATAVELYKVARYLGGDHHRAEDLVQVTFLTVIESVGSFREGERVLPWLLGILANRARDWRRRDERQAAATRDVIHDDPALAAERAEFAQALDSTLRHIEAPYREVLVLHLQHGLSPKEIANALQRQDGTVRSQLSRGLEHLREALPAGFALGVAVTALAPNALAALRARVLGAAFPGAATGSGVSFLAGALLMKKVVATLLAFALLGLGGWWLATSGGGAPGTEAAAAVAAGSDMRAEAIAASEPMPLSRVAVNASRPASARRAALVVKVTFADGSPACGTVVSCEPGSTWSWDRLGPTRRANAQGLARFEPIEAGTWHVSCDRGVSTYARVADGGQEHVELGIPRGIDVRGLVVDHLDRPVEGATIWLSKDVLDNAWKPIEGFEVTHADREGRFELRAVKSKQGVSAFGPAAMPAPVMLVEGKPGDTVDLRLKYRKDVGGLVRGRVLDWRGEPVADAVLQVGIGTRGVAPVGRLPIDPTRTTRSDERGEFAFYGIGVLYASQLWARAPRHAAFLTQVAPREGRETYVEVRLQRGATVRGVARDQAGEPVAGLGIDAKQDGVEPRRNAGWAPPEWATPHCTTRADGTFELALIKPGAVRLVTAEQSERFESKGLRAEIRMTLQDGEERGWDPILAEPPRIEGIVVDEQQQPIADLEMRAEGGSSSRYLGATTTVEGLFVIRGCEPDATYELIAYGKQQALGQELMKLPGIRAGDERVKIVIPRSTRPSAFLRGKLVDWQGAPVVKARFFAGQRTASVDNKPEASGEPGSFRLGPLRAGRHEIVASLDGRGGLLRLGTFEVTQDETKELGTIVLERPARVTLKVREPDGTVPLFVLAMVDDLATGQRFASMVHGGQDMIVRSAGNYRISSMQPKYAIWARDLHLESGQEQELEVRLEKGISQGIELPQAERAEHTVELVWRDAQGSVLCTAPCQLVDGKPYTQGFTLLPGVYTVEVRDKDKQPTTTRVVVRDSGAAQEPLRLPLPR